MLEVGDQVGSYRIDAVLSSGGMGRTFLAHRVGAAGFTRQAAIKVIHPELSSDAGYVRMFIDEAKLCSRIDHPNIVRVEELGEIEDGYFIAMEYVHGCSLAQMLRELGKRGRRLTPEVAISIVVQAADGLHAAHEVTGEDGVRLGVVHRDVSPQNILLATTGHVKVIDFGVAKTSRRAHIEESGLVGKIAYMSPEQAAGEAVDRRADVYALGIVLWEMLAGRRLFASPDRAKMLWSVLHPQVRPPSAYAPALSPALDAIVMAALAADPAERLGTALELRTKLTDVVPRALLVGPAQVAELAMAVLPELAEASGAAGRPRTLPPTVVSSPSIEAATTPAPYEALDSIAIVELMTHATVPVPEHETWSLDDDPEIDERTAPSAAAGRPSPRRTGRWIVLGLLGTLGLLGFGVAAGLAFVGSAREPDVPTAPLPRVSVTTTAPSPSVVTPATPALAPTLASERDLGDDGEVPRARSEPGATRVPLRPRSYGSRGRSAERARTTETRVMPTRPTPPTRPATPTTPTRPATRPRLGVPIVSDPGL